MLVPISIAMTKQFSKWTLLSPQDRQLLEYLRENPPARGRELKERPPTMGERAADFVASTVGSWRFIIIQTVLLIIWIILNVTAWKNHWDPYPFILLNLMLSFQAAYTGPIVMMSQNRAGDIDRKRAQQDLDCDLQAFLEIQSVAGCSTPPKNLSGSALKKICACDAYGWLRLRYFLGVR